MRRITPHPDHLFDPSTRHLMVWPHQDDEVMYTGLIGRLGPETDFLWVTNGDGLAPEAGEEPAAYAARRMAETDAVLGTLGRPLARRVNLAVSEIELYDLFIALTLTPERRGEVMDRVQEIGEAVFREVKRAAPAVVWVPAFQNGHPEHDLVHVLAALAVRRLRAAGQSLSLYQVPEYEYLIFIPHRFHPLYRGPVHA
ncbi:MAG: PIG-L family deacetylase, partial [Deltaproteobacteria bacterium]|nr:PIG-L family deacetylase [Deltaproteobacteria bacterium]